MTSSLALVLTACNAQETIMETIESVLSQRRLPDQLGLVIGSSQDRTADYALFYEEEFDFVEHAPRQHSLWQGHGSLRLRGFSHVSTDYVCFLPAETFLYREALARLSEGLSDEPDLLAGALTVWPPEGPERVQPPPSDLSRDSLYQKGPVHGGTLLWKTGFLSSIREALSGRSWGPFTSLGWLLVAANSKPRFRTVSEPLLETWSSVYGPHCWTRAVYRSLENLHDDLAESSSLSWEPLCDWVRNAMGETGGTPAREFLSKHLSSFRSNGLEAYLAEAGDPPEWLRGAVVFPE